MVKVKISEGMRNEALKHHKKMMSKGYIKPGGNYTGVEDKSRFYVGKMAELAFQFYLIKKCIAHQYTEVDRPDDQDFILYHQDHPVTIDVKGTNGLHTKVMGTPVKRFKKDSHDVYVGVRVGDDVCEIVGYLRRDQMQYLDNTKPPISRFGFREPQYGDLYENITPIDKLITNMDKDMQYETCVF